jgi:hypothetical protein
MTLNTAIWDSVCRVPKESLKGFTRAGGFSGTAIKPMWSIKAMTEQFGPCGRGWGIDRPEFQIVNGHEGEVLVYCTVTVWHGTRDNKLFGVGGDKIVAQFKSGLKSDDEAFKKAFTDAVGNALKFLGVGGDIHMGLWDGNKYIDEGIVERAKSPPAPVVFNSDDKSVMTGNGATTKRDGRDDYARLLTELRKAATVDGLKEWLALRRKEIDELPPDWIEHLRADYMDMMDGIKAKFAGEVLGAG